MNFLKKFEDYQLQDVDKKFYNMQPETELGKKRALAFRLKVIQLLVNAEDDEERSDILNFYYNELAKRFGHSKAMYLIIGFKSAMEKELIKKN